MKSNKQELYQKSFEITDLIEKRSFGVLRLLGYTLLLFTFIDYIAILVPPRLTNPDWELKVISMFVDRIWSPLLGLTFIFLFTEKSLIYPREIKILKILSWAAFFLGLLYLLMLPLGINNSLTIYRNFNNQVTNKVAQRTEQLQKINEQLKSTNNPEQLRRVAQILNPQSQKENNTPPEELKNKLSQQIEQVVQNVEASAKATKKQQAMRWIKESVRINLGAFLGGACFITFWNLTRWVRIIDKNAN
ncbi:MAG: HpsJ family protein [Nostocaceae cyanobacterium]|nr:HpsJ family protein [Nostocaceae cyanobacterium]